MFNTITKALKIQEKLPKVNKPVIAFVSCIHMPTGYHATAISTNKWKEYNVSMVYVKAVSKKKVITSASYPPRKRSYESQCLLSHPFPEDSWRVKIATRCSLRCLLERNKREVPWSKQANIQKLVRTTRRKARVSCLTELTLSELWDGCTGIPFQFALAPGIGPFPWLHDGREVLTAFHHRRQSGWERRAK